MNVDYTLDMLISCDYLFYADNDTVICPKFSNFLRILEIFLIPFGIIMVCYHVMSFMPKYTSVFLKICASSNVLNLLFYFVIFSVVLHSLFYLLFSINYYRGYYSVIILNFLCFASVLLWYFLNLPNRYGFINVLFICNITLVILGCKDSLLFTIDDDGRLILNRNEDISIIIKNSLYTIFISIEDRVLKDVKYEIYLLRLLSQRDIMLLSTVDQIKRKFDNPIQVSYMKMSDYAKTHNETSYDINELPVDNAQDV